MKQDLKNNPNIKLGDVELGPEYSDPKNAKLRITAWIDGDIFLELQRRADAGECNGKYQTLMNEILRKALFDSPALDQLNHIKAVLTEIVNTAIIDTDFKKTQGRIVKHRAMTTSKKHEAGR